MYGLGFDEWHKKKPQTASTYLGIRGHFLAKKVLQGFGAANQI